MLRGLVLTLALSGMQALAARADVVVPRPAHPGLDAFLASPAQRPLVEAGELSRAGAALWRESTVTGTEPRLGVPTFLWARRTAPGGRTLKDLGLTAEQAARRYLVAHAELYRGSAQAWGEATLTRLHELHDGGPVVAQFEQRVQGRRVFHDQVKIVMTAAYELVALSGYLTPDRRVQGAFELTPESAVASAFADLSGRALEPSSLALLDLQGGFRRFRLGEEPTLVRVQDVLFPLVGGLEPAFYLELELSRGTDSDYFSYVVSARSGEVLFRNDLTRADSYGYRVFADASGEHIPLDGPAGNDSTPHPTGSRSTWAPAWVAPTLLTLAAGPISTSDVWLPPGSGTLNGNNAHAYADLVKPQGFNSGDYEALATAAGVFDLPFDPTKDPESSPAQRMGAITQLFYNVNFLHDWFYDRGFDEKAGNAQNANFARGGKDGDAIQAEAQDYSGRSNANMSTPSDGASPRMQMYIFDAATSSQVRVLTPTSATLSAGSAEFGPQSFSITGTLVLVDDNDPSGTGGTKTDGCSVPTNNVSGKVVLIDRGLCTFAKKAQNAAAAGAIAVIIADNVSDTTPLGLAGTDPVTIPTVGITLTSGGSLKGQLAAGPVTVAVERVGAVNADGAVDNTIVAHEWGHYLSNRLIGDGNGLNTNAGNGMGEGWSDFTSMLMVVRAQDAAVPSNADWAGVYGMAGYTTVVTDPEGYYFGIRRVPYSTNLSKNGLTFTHVQDNVPLPSAVPTAWGLNGQNNSEAHNTGEVWATVLWECYAALLRDPRYTFPQAQDKMMRYLVAAYKVTHLSPTMLEARDALLAVAAATDLADYETFWRAFAKRGFGMGAVGPARAAANNSPVTESFDVGSAVQVVGASLDDSITSCDHDGNLDNDEVGVLSLTFKNIGIGAIQGGTATVSSTLAGLTFPGGAQVALPTLTPFQSASVSFQVQAAGIHGKQGATFDLDLAAPGLIGGGHLQAHQGFRVNFDVKPGLSGLDDVESPASLWTSAADFTLDTGSPWTIFTASATDHFWLGPDPAFPADLYLTSPALNVASNQDFVVTFKHRYDLEKDTKAAYDGAVIEVTADNGANWVDVGAAATPAYNSTLDNQGAGPLGGRKAWSGKSPGYPAFQNVTVGLGRRYAGQTVKFRFRVGSDDALGGRGWEVDDIQFAGITNQPFPMVMSDPNACGTNRAPEVTMGPDQVVPEGSLVTLTATATDADHDPLTFTWTQKQGPDVSLTTDKFSAPPVKADTLLVFELVVTDGLHDVGPFPVRVTVQSTNRAPVVTVPATLQVMAGESLAIAATGTDADGDPLTWEWSETSGPFAALRGDKSATVTLTAPIVDAEATVTLEVVVRDASHTSAPATVAVTVTPVAPPAPPKGCGCATGGGLEGLSLLILGALLRRRRH